MAGASSSSSFTYDNFLSFRGEDTRHGFTGSLYKALAERGIHSFLDDVPLQRRDDGIMSSYFKAIEESRSFIIVFSEGYASSSFCLDELVHILESFQGQGNRRFVWPIFYGVEPSHVQKQTESYGQALAEHEMKFKDNMEKVQKWKNALHQVANFPGWHLQPGDKDENKSIQSIAEKVSMNISCDPLDLRDYLLGVESQEKEEKSHLDDVVSNDEFNKITQTAHNVLQSKMTWRIVGFGSSVVGLSCNALSPSFNRLIGGWNTFKLFLYGLLSLATCATILFAKQSSLSMRQVQLKTYVGFVVLMIVSVYSFFYDKAVSGKPDILSLVSNAAFALMSLSLSRLIKFGFEVGIFSFFLSCLAIQLVAIDLKLILVAIIYGCPLFILHSSSDSQLEVDSAEVIHSPSHFQSEVDRGDQVIYSPSNSILEAGGQSQHVINFISEASKHMN